MPELPEVEVVRVGLAPAVTGARVSGLEVVDARSLKRHIAMGGGDPAADFERRLSGALLGAPARRGKFLWVPVAGGAGSGSEAGSDALLAHLGMSGQLLLRAPEAMRKNEDRFVRIRLWIEHPEHGELRVDFADQRRFGSLAIDALRPTADGRPGGRGAVEATIPGQAAHIARDPLDPAFEDEGFLVALRSRRTAVKRALLDQTLISGIGNIYADEALWRSRVHPETPGERIGPRKARELLAQVRAVFAQALVEGGTSFDEQYVNVNGEAGYFSISLHAYGRTGEPCARCGTQIKRIVIGGRSSHFCPRCQRK